MTPRAAESLPDLVPPLERTVPSSPNPRSALMQEILVVDDLSCSGWVWAAALRRAGFQLSIAADTDAGWLALDEPKFVLLIASQDVTGRRSSELVAKVRRQSRRMPCILVGDNLGDDLPEAMRLLRPGVVLEKSVPISRVLAVVRSLLKASVDPEFAPVSARGFAPFRTGW